MKRSDQSALSVRPQFDFGPTSYGEIRDAVGQIDVGENLAETRQRIRLHCPKLPGVYGMLDRRDELVYVGMSSDLRERLVSYFYQSCADERQRNVVTYAHRIVWESNPHEFIALLRELELIRRWRPPLNTKGQPGKVRSGYLSLTTDEAPHFRVDKKPPRQSREVWGPVRLNQRTRTAVQYLNHVCWLRDCPSSVKMRFSDQQQLFPVAWPVQCERGETDDSLVRCLAPCGGRCTKEQYQSHVHTAQSLLEGRDATVLNELVKVIDDSVVGGQYERATQAQQVWDELTYLCQQVRLSRGVSWRYRFVYEFHTPQQKTMWMPITGGRPLTVVEAPRSREAAQRCLALLESTFAGEMCVVDDFEIVQLLSSWFRRNPDELDRAFDPVHLIEECRMQAGMIPIAA